LDAVLKIGGSLLGYPNELGELCLKIDALSESHRLILVPGGGPFAGIVKDYDRKFGLSSSVSHWMAVQAMSQYGFLLSDIMFHSRTVSEVEDVGRLRLPIFLPLQLLREEDLLAHSWDVTSDSIAAYVAGRLGVKTLILAKDVDGIFDRDPKRFRNAKLIGELSAEDLVKLGRKTCVDLTLPRLLKEEKLDCYVVNGRFPERLVHILQGKADVYTRILAHGR